ncbi:hypothetical protein [Sulfuritalea sp.]|uniref:hypothetical protein n=1 Tax=Sulfuritalea sp. TaxID=2480090 RepID=UPI001AC66FA2|nr:hypothetical protein [Sulfuritalea sp.]MBN8476594.1 hypothetical protein [Sulfuritalea sp.]
MSVTYLTWSVLSLVAVLLVVLALRAERRRFAARGKAVAWLGLRLASLPIGLVAAAAVWLPARAVNGPEALAAFYLLMFSLGPLVYFGLHWLAGRMATPALSAGEAASIAVSGLLMVILPALLASMASPWVHQLDLGAQQMQRSLAAEAPLAHRIADRRRLLLPEIGEVLTEHWQAPPGIKVERIEWELGGQYLQTGDSTGSILCRDGEDFHVFRLTADPAPRWRMHWRDAAGSLQRSAWTSAPAEAATPAAAMAPSWTPDGFAFPVRIPRDFVSVERRWASGKVLQSGALDGQALPAPTDTCLPTPYRNRDAESVVTGVAIRMWLRDARRMGLAGFSRPPE